MVSLLGVYGNMINGEILTIEIECDFKLLNDLLSSAGDQAEHAIEELASALNNINEEVCTIDVLN